MLLILVDRVVERTEESTIDSTPIENDGILLILATLDSNRNNRIITEWHLLRSQKIHHACLHKGTHGRTENIPVLIQTFRIILCLQTHRLLSHRRLVRITRRLVVIAERNARSHMTQNQCGMDFAMGMRMVEFGRLKCNSNGFGFARINLLEIVLNPCIPIRRIRGRRCNLPIHNTEERTHETTSV